MQQRRRAHHFFQGVLPPIQHSHTAVHSDTVEQPNESDVFEDIASGFGKIQDSLKGNKHYENEQTTHVVVAMLSNLYEERLDRLRIADAERTSRANFSLLFVRAFYSSWPPCQNVVSSIRSLHSLAVETDAVSSTPTHIGSNSFHHSDASVSLLELCSEFQDVSREQQSTIRVLEDEVGSLKCTVGALNAALDLALRRPVSFSPGCSELLVQVSSNLRKGESKALEQLQLLSGVGLGTDTQWNATAIGGLTACAKDIHKHYILAIDAISLLEKSI